MQKKKVNNPSSLHNHRDREEPRSAVNSARQRNQTAEVYTQGMSLLPQITSKKRQKRLLNGTLGRTSLSATGTDVL